MKLHELRPAAGSRTARTRVGRGIAAGKGKTAGRGTKGQKARAGSSIPPWFEGGQTPLHQRIPKLRGFRNPFKLQYEVVNLGRITALVELGALEAGDLPGRTPKPGGKAAPVTVNQEILKAVGLVRSLDKPLKVLGQGEVTRPLFVVADAFSRSAVSKIEAAGGSVSVIEIPGPGGERRRPDRAAGTLPSETPTDGGVEEHPAGTPPERPARAPAGKPAAQGGSRARSAQAERAPSGESEARAEATPPLEEPAESASGAGVAEQASEVSTEEPPKRTARTSRAGRGRASGRSQTESEPTEGSPDAEPDSQGGAPFEPASEAQPSGDD
jgi:large subunit ribosomal protein L15